MGGPCRACKAFQSEKEWRALPLVESMRVGEAGALLRTRWTGRVIEIRRCPKCERGIARFAPGPSQ